MVCWILYSPIYARWDIADRVSGIFVMLFVATMTMMFVPSSSTVRRNHRRFVTPVVCAMFLIATWVRFSKFPQELVSNYGIFSLQHLIIDFVRVVAAFVWTSGGQEATTQYYANLAHPLSVITNVLYATQTTIGDGVLVSKCGFSSRQSFNIITRFGDTTSCTGRACGSQHPSFLCTW